MNKYTKELEEYIKSLLPAQYIMPQIYKKTKKMIYRMINEEDKTMLHEFLIYCKSGGSMNKKIYWHCINIIRNIKPEYLGDL